MRPTQDKTASEDYAGNAPSPALQLTASLAD
jgi:hypothetical protein